MFLCEAVKDNYMWHFTMPIVKLIYNPKAEFADSLGGCIITTRKTKFNDLELKNGICVIMPLSFYIAVDKLVTKRTN